MPSVRLADDGQVLELLASPNVTHLARPTEAQPAQFRKTELTDMLIQSLPYKLIRIRKADAVGRLRPTLGPWVAAQPHREAEESRVQISQLLLQCLRRHGCQPVILGTQPCELATLRGVGRERSIMDGANTIQCR